MMFHRRCAALPMIIAFVVPLASDPARAAQPPKAPAPAWQQQGIVAAIRDPNRDTLAATVMVRTFYDDTQLGDAIAEALGSLDAASKQSLLAPLTAAAADPDVSEAATMMLGQLGAKEAVPVLVKLLRNPDSDVRAYAARALGQLGAKEAVPALVDQLSCRSQSARQAAAGALSCLGPLTFDQSVSLLERAYTHQDELANCAYTPISWAAASREPK
jgi:HEAT repeat protein